MSKVLVVDDSRTIRIIIRRILIELGYEVCEAANGIEALKVLETEKTAVKLVLADEWPGTGQVFAPESRI